MATVVSIPDKYVEMAIKITGEYNPKKAILKVIEMVCSNAITFTTASELTKHEEIKTREIKENQSSSSENIDIWKKISRAKRYRDKIIKQEGYITEEKLKWVAKKFGIPIDSLWDDLIMKEEGKYYPLKEQQNES